MRETAGLIKLPSFVGWSEIGKAQNIWTSAFVAAIETARDTSRPVPWRAVAAPGASPAPPPLAAAKLDEGPPVG
jgi:hypothetical protein